MTSTRSQFAEKMPLKGNVKQNHIKGNKDRKMIRMAIIEVSSKVHEKVIVR
jgi:hypothetical protein